MKLKCGAGQPVVDSSRCVVLSERGNISNGERMRFLQMLLLPRPNGAVPSWGFGSSCGHDVCLAQALDIMSLDSALSMDRNGGVRPSCFLLRPTVPKQLISFLDDLNHFKFK